MIKISVTSVSKDDPSQINGIVFYPLGEDDGFDVICGVHPTEQVVWVLTRGELKDISERLLEGDDVPGFYLCGADGGFRLNENVYETDRYMFEERVTAGTALRGNLVPKRSRRKAKKPEKLVTICLSADKHRELKELGHL